MTPSRQFLDELYRTAVAAAHPAHCLAPHLPAPLHGRLILLAAGKAAGAMTEIAERHYLDELGLAPALLAGIAATRPGYARPTRIVELV
jgi:glycerate 2-kinase